MDNESAVASLSALAQDTRLSAFQLLASREPQGLPAGEVARQLNVPQNTMSVHLATLARAGLIRSERHSRHIIYRADCAHLMALALFLAKGCNADMVDENLTLLKDVQV
ncbi:TPA: helix-turn-helix transcriptional regulator [Pseudomonas aeruginosa]|nr:helix-turn-helix transcriptional regulator [Pseudomonas aeruginosa]